MGETLEARLARLEDKAAIGDVLTAIARGTDRFDPDLLASAIWPDAALDMGGAEPMQGAAFCAALRPPATARPGRMHLLTNTRIEVTGDSGRAESYILSFQDVMVDGVRTTRVRGGRYLDRFEKRDGRWGLIRRTLIDEWGRLDAVGEIVPPGRHLGAPAPLDLSYTS
ncbi:nuclear transport factor 2 family protein [Sphingomonas profundi]|uniref:nuclear transport factor 2 family protein n=1 Tax=Alterirhizorhabdus profundi TaxID=2681549 RepID=UPI0012E8C77D|nr:nuclear transport factor 2 family protein [Sphingomonas profundi]